MGGPSKVNIGSNLNEFPGRSFNLLVQEWYRQHAQMGRGSKSGTGPGQFIIVKARNTTGATLKYGDCAAIEGLAIPFGDKTNQQYNRPLLKAQKHTSSLHHAIMGVSTRTVVDGQPGPFIISGTAWVRTNYTDEGHHFVTLEEDQSTFSPLAISASSGLPILDSETIPDPEYLPATLWALVVLGGGGETYRLIGGNTVGAVADTDATFLIDNVVKLSGGVDPSEGNPATQVRVANVFQQEYADNEYVQAVHSPEVVADPATDWEATTKSVDENPPLRRFELTAAKVKADLTATAKWLDHADAMVGDPVTLHDPGQQFYGKAADYVGTIDGFRGFALLRTDLAETDPGAPRWEIIAMEGFAETVEITWVDSSPTLEWQMSSFYGDQWEWKRPVADDAALTVDDPTDIGDAKENGDIGIAHLKNPDTSPPTYELRTIKRAGGGAEAALVRTTATLAAGSGDPRTPGTTSSYTVILGTASGVIQNYSTVEISNGTYVGIIKIDGGWVVWPAFC